LKIVLVVTAPVVGLYIQVVVVPVAEMSVRWTVAPAALWVMVLRAAVGGDVGLVGGDAGGVAVMVGGAAGVRR
jgi:hypothetical protein